MREEARAVRKRRNSSSGSLKKRGQNDENHVVMCGEHKE